MSAKETLSSPWFPTQSMILSTPMSSKGSLSVYMLRVTMHFIPADLAACAPILESSITTQSFVCAFQPSPSISFAASSYTAGSGFFLGTMSPANIGMSSKVTPRGSPAFSTEFSTALTAFSFEVLQIAIRTPALAASPIILRMPGLGGILLAFTMSIMISVFSAWRSLASSSSPPASSTTFFISSSPSLILFEKSCFILSFPPPTSRSLP
mmetsp:Transcript_6519/g.19274  ORF Transcript_6519/g.19274 Transcript_6519/m.19274 type:complete len:210 (+) Transcript_6519:2349-2978(+)